MSGGGGEFIKVVGGREGYARLRMRGGEWAEFRVGLGGT